MAKYVFHKCTSCQIGGKLYRKSDKVVFDTEDPKFSKVKNEIIAAAEAGYLEDVSKGSNEDRKAKADYKKEAEAKAEKLAEEAKAKKAKEEKAKADLAKELEEREAKTKAKKDK